MNNLLIQLRYLSWIWYESTQFIQSYEMRKIKIHVFN